MSKTVGFIMIQVFRAKLHEHFILKSIQLFELNVIYSNKFQLAGKIPVRFANWCVFAR